MNHLYAVNKRDGCTAMHRAVECISEKRGLENLLLLIAKDSSAINLQNTQGLTPLHLAAKLEKRQIIKVLMVRMHILMILVFLVFLFLFQTCLS